MSLDLDIETVDSLRAVNEVEAAILGLEAVPHGLLLATERDGTRLTLATPDPEQLMQMLTAARTDDHDFARVVIRAAPLKLLAGWPDDDIGIDVTDPERDAL